MGDIILILWSIESCMVTGEKSKRTEATWPDLPVLRFCFIFPRSGKCHLTFLRQNLTWRVKVGFEETGVFSVSNQRVLQEVIFVGVDDSFGLG